jgi:hypothetical protein
MSEFSRCTLLEYCIPFHDEAGIVWHTRYLYMSMNIEHITYQLCDSQAERRSLVMLYVCKKQDITQNQEEDTPESNLFSQKLYL